MINFPLTDSHCHLDKLKLDDYQDSLDNLFLEAKKCGVLRFLCVCIDSKKFHQVLEIAEKYPFVYASVGSHPCNDFIKQNEFKLTELIEFAKHPKVIAIGETGIDYFHQDKENVLYQHNRLIEHIEAARVVKKPLIIHMRNSKNQQKATDDFFSILKTYGKSEVRGVMHCFAENLAVAKRALDLGFYISFSGIVTFKNAKDLQKVAQFVPSDSYLIETDSPWLTPVPFRGKTNFPHYVYYVAKAMSDLRGVDLATISEQTELNFNQLFLN